MPARRLLKIGFTLAVGVTAAALLVAKQSPRNPPPLITLNLSAVDGEGRPVQDLHAGDLQVIDDGKPLPVVWLRSLTTTRAREPRATFILIDLYNNNFQSRGLAENEVVQALAKIDSGANIYLYLLTPAATIFPVHGIAASSDAQWTQHVKASLDEALRQVNGIKSADQTNPIQRIPPTWKALSHFVAQLAQVPGPKSLVWITQGIQNGFFVPDYTRHFVQNVTPLREFADVLNALGTAIYTVEQEPRGSLEVASQGSVTDTLDKLSELTGGQSFPTDSTSQAITQAMASVQRTNYRLGFSPQKTDGKYHRIHLTSTRSDVKIQAAERYYGSGTDPDRDLTARDPGRMLESIESSIGQSPFDYAEIGVRASLSNSTLTIHLDGHDPLFLQEGGRYQAELSVYITARGPNGATKSVGPLAVNIDMSEAEHAKALVDGIDIPRPLTPDGGTGPVRVTVLDHNSYLAGTSTIAVGR